MVPILLDLGAEYFHWQGKAYHFLVSFQIFYTHLLLV